ncbi:MAG: hypothetical protein RLT05_04240 [Bauldia litoralis]
MKSRTCLAVAGVLMVLPQIAIAEEPVEAAIRERVAAIDASPDWSASYGGLRYDSLTDTATVTDFVARADRLGSEVAIARLSVTGYAGSLDGSFRAKSIVADGGVITLGLATIEIGDLGIEDLAVPRMGDVVFSPNQPFTSMIKGYAEAVKTSFARARVGSVVVVQTIEDIESRIVYEHLRLDDFANGRLASMRAGPLRLESPSPQGLVTTTIGSVEGSGLDLAAFVRVYDPDAYQNGVGDMAWQDGIDLVAYHDIQMEVPGGRFSIDGIAVENTRVRQPPIPFASFLDAVMLDPNMPPELMQRLSLRHLPGLLGSWSFGRVGVTGFAIDVAGIDRMAFSGFDMTDISVDGIGEIAIEGLESAVRGQFAMRLGRFAIGDIPLGGIEGLTDLVAAIDSGKDIDPESLAPGLGFLELVDLNVQTPDIERLGLARVRLDTSDYVGLFPTSASLEVSGLVIPTDAITDRQARALLERFGYEKVDFSFFLDTAWQAAGEVLTVKDLRFGLEDMGGLAMKFAIGGFPLGAAHDEALMMLAYPRMTLLDAEVTFEDESIVGNGLDMLAEQMNAPPETFRKQFADAIPFFLSMATVNDPQLMALIQRSGLLPKLVPVIRDFVAVPGSSITLSAQPPKPVGLVALTDAVENAPATLVDLLGLTITGTPGEVAPEPVEEMPVEEAPAEVAPVEEAPAEAAPVEAAPVEEAPAAEDPDERKPIVQIPIEDIPVEDIPVEDAPAEQPAAAPAEAPGAAQSPN